MSQREPITKTVTIDEAQQQFDQLIAEVITGNTYVSIVKDGEAVARLGPAMSPKQREINAMLKDPEFLRLSSIGLAFKDVPIDELEAQVTRALRESRDKRCEERKHIIS